MNEFIAHWIQVNLALGNTGPLVVGNGVTVANLITHRDGLEALATAIQGRLNDVEIARGNLELLKVQPSPSGRANSIIRSAES